MSWDKYGSPYDPNHSGKMQKPRDKRSRRNEDQYQLRGCGDPNCPSCNSHIPREVAATMSGARGGVYRGSRPEFVVLDDISSSLGDSIRRAMEERSESFFRDMIGREFVAEIKTEPREEGPPASYKKARKKVKDWITVVPEQAFDDIKGNGAALSQLRDAIEAPVKHKAIYEAYGMKMPKGALLSGPPGCGKTMFARAAAWEMKQLYGSEKKETLFLSISGSEIQSPWVGVTEGHIKAIFDFAKEYKAYHGYPLPVFIDEADVLLPDRTGRIRRVAPWEESQVAVFLAEMDGIEESAAFVLLATNRPEVIDQAVLRDGRCDFKITVKRPDREAIEHILTRNFEGVLAADKTSDLIFAAVEALHDPFKVIMDAHAALVRFELKQEGPEMEMEHHFHKHFLLEHILSGAMAASIPARAKRFAFARDKETGEAKGVTVGDVVAAVNALFEENQGLEHEFALNEFRQEFEREWEEVKKTPKKEKK